MPLCAVAFTSRFLDSCPCVCNGKRRLFATFRWPRVIARLMGATRTMGDRRNGRGLIRAP